MIKDKLRDNCYALLEFKDTFKFLINMNASYNPNDLKSLTTRRLVKSSTWWESSDGKEWKEISVKLYRKGNIVYKETDWGSFVDMNEYGMVQQKNALSEKELIRYGYKRIN